MEFAVVDLKAERAARDLARASEETGSYFVANHGVPLRLIERVLEESARFHGLPLEHKLSIRGSITDPLGYLGPPQTVETYYIRDEFPPNHPDRLAKKPWVYDNRWIEGLPGFRETMLEYIGAMCALVERLLALHERALGLAPGSITRHEAFSPPGRLLRLLRYPARRNGEDLKSELGTHTDYGYLTVLARCGVPGLQMQTPAGDWFDVPAEDGLLLITNGDMCQFWTNGRFRSPPHRASNTHPTERFSAAFFTAPRADVALECWPGCLEPGAQPRYSARSYQSHVVGLLAARGYSIG